MTETTIPPITNPLGKYWKQPKVENIKFAFGCAWVSKNDYDLLPEYSTSNPTGAYEGKMWKRISGKQAYLCFFVNDPADPENYLLTKVFKLMTNEKYERNQI